jgi:hypothetical protein
MATFFENALLTGLGTSEQTLITVNANTSTTVLGLSFTNLTGSIVTASVRLTQSNSSGTVLSSAYFVYNVVVPPNQSLRVLNGGEKLVLTQYMAMHIQCNTDNSLDVVASYVNIL